MTNYSELLINYRRHFHQFPEIGWSEFKTTTEIMAILRSLDFKVLCSDNVINRDFIRGREAKIVESGLAYAKDQNVDELLLQELKGLTGCVGILETGKSGPVTALRFDIDCVNVSETPHSHHFPKQSNFQSQREGLMHACGHDGHIAIGLTLAHWLKDHKDQLTGKIKILFQPAEEGVRGARPMAESGIIDDADYFLSAHLGFIANSGEIVINPSSFLCTTKIDIRYKGLSSHAGAEPHKGRNALAGACHAVTQMLGIPRHGDGSSRINVGQIIAGEGRNVTPSHAEIKLEVRGETESINTYMVNQVMAIAQGCALSFNLEYETEIMGEAVDLINDIELVDLIRNVAQKTNGVHSVIDDRIFGGSEDATILAKRVQSHQGKAIYFIIGSNRTAGHHQSEFDFNEQDLMVGLSIFHQAIQQLNGV